MTHTFENVVKGDHCEPNGPVPQQEHEMCDGEMQLAGTFKLECCCPRLQTRTFIINIGPQSEGSLITYLQNTVNAYENSGYLILGHSLVDAGAGWILGLTIGWYA